MPPPAPTAASWRWSPTSSSFAPAASTWRWIAARAAVSVIADSSTTTRSPARSRHASSPSTGAAPAGAGGEPVLGGQPAGDVAGGQAFAGEDVGGDLAGGQPEHPPRPAPPRRAGSVQASGERADDERLAGAGRADQGLDPRAGGEHPAHGGGLVGAELDARTRRSPSRNRCAALGRQRRGAAGGGGGDAGRARCARAPGWRRAARRAPGRPTRRWPAAARRAAASSPGRARPAARRSVEGLVGELVEQRGDVGAVGDAEVVGQRGVDRAGEVGAGPAGLAALHVGQRGLDHRLRRPRLRGRAAARGRPSTVVRDPGQAAGDLGAQLRVDPVEQLLAGLPVVRLRPPGRERGLLGQPVALQRRSAPGRSGPRTPSTSSAAFAVTCAAPRARSGPSPPAATPTISRAFPSGRVADQHPERVGQPLLGGALGDRGRGRRATGSSAARVEGAPHPVRALDPVEDRRCGCAAAGRGRGSRAGRTTRRPSRGRRPSGRRRRRGARPGSSRRARPGRPAPALLPAQIASSTASRYAAHAAAASSSPAVAGLDLLRPRTRCAAASPTSAR